MHALDNPVWHALTGPHATLAERAGFAARYIPDVAVFTALPDDTAPAMWDDLRELVGPSGTALLVRSEPAVPDAWTEQFALPCRQMLLPSSVALDDADDPHESFLLLTHDDVPDMLALVERTRPGPFSARTIELGTYLGVRENGALIAMAGERMHPEGYTEISAVCTDSTHRGRGLASQLVRAIARRIRARNETPFLHLTIENESARRVYSSLGFETRILLDVIAVEAPS